MRYGTAGAWAENFLAKTVGAETPKDLAVPVYVLGRVERDIREFLEERRTSRVRERARVESVGRVDSMKRYRA